MVDAAKHSFYVILSAELCLLMYQYTGGVTVRCFLLIGLVVGEILLVWLSR